MFLKLVLTQNNGANYLYEVNKMAFTPKPTKKKVEASYKTLYIKDELSEKITALAKEHNTSFNNIVISILEDFFKTN